ncbi:carboxypeptidase regulatory-like domain-containing protein [Roseateles sp. LKC17W]|uniref:Carboxypeptidase regulatory-like domain-containing protein n=2 Tax=Pelomonas margarita TaxID=3299031 RepID=A0ABW7FQ48_9BURK
MLTWLLSAQQVDGSWSSSIHLTAQALNALTLFGSDVTARVNARAYLLARQDADGSWSGDPFVTAVALRALAADPMSAPTTPAPNPDPGQPPAPQPPTTPSPSTISGIAANPASGSPLAGVQVVLAGTSSSTQTTAANGSFSFPSLAAGDYAVTLTKDGFNTARRSFSVGLGQAIDLGTVSLTQAATTGVIKGRVTVSANGQPFAGVTVTVSGSMNATRTTDAQGGYEFSSVPPGAVSISASRSGYATVAGSASLAAGESLTFSPALTATTEQQPTGSGRFKGHIVAAGSNAPLAGVNVMLNGAQAGVSNTTGAFDITLAPGSYSLRLAQPGYDVVTGSFVITAATATDAGNIRLTEQRQSTTISGRVTDTANGKAVPGALVEVVGGASARAAADGSYTIAGLSGTAFNLRASSQGFLTQAWQIQVERPTAITQNFALAALPSAVADLTNLGLAPATVGPAEVVTLTAILTNTGNAPQDVVVRSLVLDESGKVIAKGGAFAADGATQLGGVTLAAGTQRPIVIKWDTGLFAPGVYQLQGLVVQAGTITHEAPEGRVLATRGQSFTITGKSKIAGAASAQPAVMRAGLGTSTQLSAIVQNVGNVELPARTYRLDVIDEKTATRVASLEAAGAAMAVSALQTINFGAWTPVSASNFKLVVSAPTSPEDGQVVGKVYVGDAASAIYTVNKAVVGAGDQTVRANIKVTGQESASGSVSDPLAPLIRNAITKAVNYADGYASSHYVNDLRCFACHVQTQALVGGEKSRRFAPPLKPLERSTLYNGMTQYMASNGQVDGAGFPLANTSLALWAALAWHEQDAHPLTKTRMAGYLLQRQAASGDWSSDHASSWWGAAGRAPLTSLNLQSFTTLRQRLSQATTAPSVLATLVPWTVPGLPSGDMRMSAAPDGTLYISHNGAREVWRVAPDKTATRLASNLSMTGLHYLDDGRLLLTTRNGIFLMAVDNSLTKLNSLDTWDAIPYKDGYLVSPYGGGTLYKMSADGAVLTPVFSDPLLASSSGSLVPQPDGSVLVNSYAGLRLVRFNPDGGGLVDVPMPLLSSNPQNIIKFRDGNLFTTENGMYYLDANWVGERLTFDRTMGMVVMPDGRLLVNRQGGLYELKSEALDTAGWVSRLDASIDKAAAQLANPSPLVDTNDNVQLAFQLMGLGAVKSHYGTSARGTRAQSDSEAIAAVLRPRQRGDGGWSRYGSSGVSDTLVTAMVGVALDVLNPSPSSPEVRSAIQFILGQQRANGLWVSESGTLGAPELLATTWVEIWLPVMLDRVAGIDTDLKLKFASNVAVSNPNLAPAEKVLNSDGTTSHTWRLVGVTSASQDIQFDLGLQNMQVGESRPASLEAALSFSNSEGGDPVIFPVTIPKVTASAFLGHAVSTDKQAYSANAPVTFSSQVSNLGASATTASVEFRVLSADGTVLATLARAAVTQMAAGGNGTTAATWNTGTSYAGTYRVEARLFDSSDHFVATAQASFAIQASDAPGVPTLAAALQLDKGSYSPGDTVRLIDRVSNLAANQSWQNLSLRTVVLNPDGSTRWSATATFDELAANGLREQSYSVALSNAPAGSYQVRLTVLDANGTVQAQAAKTFTVSSTAATGVGISGHLSVAPKPVFQGGSVSVAFDVLNQGNAALTGLPLTINIVNPGTAQLLASLPVTVQNLATQASFAGSVGWTANVVPGTQVVAVLTAQVGDRSLTLAQDNLTVTTPPVTANVAPQREARVLALVSCPPGSDGGATTQPVSGGEANCAVRRGAALAQALTNLGLVNKVVTTRAEFETELRCGIYNTYWISGGSNKLSDDVAKEVIEAIRRGDSLIVEGTQDGRNQLLYPVAGVQLNGSLGQTDPSISFAGSAEFPAGSLATLGRPGRFTPVGAQLQASFAPDAAALTTASFGQGRSTLVAFELARMLEQNDTARQALLDRVLQVARTSPEVVANGAPVALAIQVSNAAAQAATAQVQATVPAELQLLPGQATSWNLSLAAGQSQTLVLRVKPLQPGDWTVDVTATSGGQVNAAHYNVQAQAPEALADHAVALAQALSVNGDADTAAKSQAVQALTQAQTLGAEQRHDEALGLWLQASSALQTIQSADTHAASLATAQAMQGTERALCPQLACLSGTIQIRQGTTVPNPLPINANANVQRQVANSCPVALPSWHIGAQLRNRRTAQTLLQLDDELNLGAGQGNTAQGNFLASAGNGLAGDTLEALLVGQRLGWQHHLGRATVPLAGTLMCDVDGNGAINTLDIQLVMQSIGKTVAAGDPRDPDGDKLIKINDSRACTARCTKPNCAQ